jgi:Flp pilus assembly protein TadG
MNFASKSGQAGVMMVLSLSVVFGAIGLSADLGRAYYRRQVAQTAADAGALAAAAYATKNGTTSCSNGLCVTAKLCSDASITAGSAPYTGCQYAEANGYPAASITMTSAFSAPPSAPGTPATYWIKTTVSETLNQTFLRFAGASTATIKAEATSGVIAGTTTTPYCMYALDPSAANAFFASGSNSAVTLQNCSMAVKSSCNNGGSCSAGSYAWVTNGAGSVTVTGGSKINVTGGASDNGTICNTTKFACSGTGPAIVDPLASLAAPAVAACPGSGPGSVQYNFSSGAATLNPGVYCGGINVSGGTLTLNPGVYILNGGGLTIGSASAVVNGAGVMFYNTATSGHTIAPVTITGQPQVTLSAATSGTYKGVLFYQDRTTTYATANQINGNTSPNLTGTLYFPGSSVLFTGTDPTTPVYTAIIAKTITVNGGSNFKWDNTGQYTGLAAGSSANLIE